MIRKQKAKEDVAFSKMLHCLFDYQRFEHLPDLDSILENVESRYSRTEWPEQSEGMIPISDDDLDFVAAAGVPEYYRTFQKLEQA